MDLPAEDIMSAHGSSISHLSKNKKMLEKGDHNLIIAIDVEKTGRILNMKKDLAKQAAEA